MIIVNNDRNNRQITNSNYNNKNNGAGEYDIDFWQGLQNLHLSFLFEKL